jgi:hypothetical protein
MGFNLGSTLHPSHPLGVSFLDSSVRVNRDAHHSLTLEAQGHGVAGSLNEFMSIWGHDVNLLSTGELKMIGDLGLTRVNAVNMLPAAVLKRRLTEIERLRKEVMSADEMGWLETYVEGQGFLDSMQPFRVEARAGVELEDESSWDTAARLGEPVRVTYSMSNTITGRLTVTSGPNVLTATPDERARWRDPGGTPLIELDISALEPTILFGLQAPDFDPGDDLYDAVNRTWFDSGLTRDVAKQVTISLCYGATRRSLVTLGASESGVQRLVTDLGLARLGKRLQEELGDKGYITSPTGRPVRPKSKNPRLGALINNFVQSAGVDVSLEIFRKTCAAWSCVPHAVVHDAVYISGDDLTPGTHRECSDILRGMQFRFTTKSVTDD